MLTWFAPIFVVAVVAAAIAAKLLVRRRAPMGGWFSDSSRSAGALSVIGTMFAVMLAFVILFSLQSYQRAREGASRGGGRGDRTQRRVRASSHRRQATVSAEVLVCYGRAVIHDEWPAMEDGRSSALVETWVDRLHQDFAGAAPREARQEAAYAQWFDEIAQRRDGRRERLAEASSILPVPLWLALAIGARATLT